MGEEVGYVKSKSNLEKTIRESIVSPKEENVAFITLDSLPSYELKFVDKNMQTNEEQIIAKIEENSETTYAMYAVTLNGENKTYVNTLEEAEEVVSKIKEENSKASEIDLGIKQIYTTNLEELNTVQVADATNNINPDVQASIKEYEKEEEIKIAKANQNVFDGE